jgi:hypothetical protein
MALITLDVPKDSHLKVKQIQLSKEVSGEKINLKDLYYEIIKKGLEAFEKEKAAK